MVKVSPINLPFNIRTLWFDPADIDIKTGDNVVVKTARGIELGVAASDIIEVNDEEVEKLKSPLKPVLRIATEDDLAKAQENERMARDAMPVFRELARQTNEDMHPVSIEFLLEGDKAVFYFEAEERIDFRELVKKLASRFHVRIDMHQIGVRDEARIIGGLAHCGQVVCCKRMGGEFKPVSIKMAKDQDLSLNPQKISGLCGRLMCCLRYENEAYKDFKARAPKVGSMISTPDGRAKVISYDVPKEMITLKVDEEPEVDVPLSDFDGSKPGDKPTSIGDDAWNKAKEIDDFVFSSNSIYSTSQFTGNDKLGSAVAIHNEPKDTGRSKDGKVNAKRSNKDAPESHRKQRKRRSTVINSETKKSASSSTHPKDKGTSQDKHDNGKIRPGHKSSGLSKRSDGPKQRTKDAKPKKHSTKKSDTVDNVKSSDQKETATDTHRRRRRRSHTNLNGNGE